MLRRILRAPLVALAIFALFAVHSCKAQTLGNMPPDSWGGRHAHLGYSAIMGAVGPEFIPSRGWAWSACFGVGVWKEWKDWSHPEPGYRHGLFSRHDLLMDGLGCTLGAVGNYGLHLATGPSGGARLVYTWELR